jgi:hypothetical protein
VPAPPGAVRYQPAAPGELGPPHHDHARPARPDDAAARANKVTAAQRDAFGPRYGAPDGGTGIEGHHLPMMAGRTPVGAALVDDPRLFGLAEALLGGPAVPLPAEGVLCFGEAGRHYDDGIGVTGLKVALYLDPLTAATGAWRLLPLSQRREACGSG